MSKVLRATLPILYRSRQYRVGDALPADNEGTVQAWLEAGSAAWLDDEEKASAAKAKSVTAPLGKAGLSSDGDPEARASRIPKTPEREKPKKTTARGKK